MFDKFDKDYSELIGGPKFIECGRLFDFSGWLNAHAKRGNLNMKTGKEGVIALHEPTEGVQYSIFTSSHVIYFF